MAHSIAHKDQLQVPETAPSPWYVEGPGFRICLIYAYRDRVHPGAHSTVVREPPMTAWCLNAGQASVQLEGGPVLNLRPGRWILLPPLSRRHHFSEDAVLTSVRFRYEGKLPGNFSVPVEPGADERPALNAAADALIGFLQSHVDMNAAHWRLPASMRSPSPAKIIGFSECLLRWMAVWYASLERHVPKAVRKSAPVDPRIAATYQTLREADFTQTLEESRLAKEAGMSRAHFKRLFKEAYGTSARQVRESHRRSYVSNRLRESDHPLKHIAIDAGFSSPATFTKWFQRVIGVTPTEFRRQFTREA